MTAMARLTLVDDDTIGVFSDGVGIGIETTRSYLAETVASGSERTTMQHLKQLLGRTDVVRVWLTPIGAKTPAWSHDGPLEELPQLSPMFAVIDDDETLEQAA